MKLAIIKNRQICFIATAVILLLAVFFMIQSSLKYGSIVKLGLDFTGGSKIEYVVPEKDPAKVNSEVILGVLSDLELNNSQVQVAPTAKDSTLIVRTKAISDDPVLEKFNRALRAKYGSYKLVSIDTVSPILGPELFSSGITALIVTILAIIVYISIKFNREYACAAIAALVHDVLVVIGLYAYLGVYHGIEVNSLFITAVLTIFGFSVHDTIVVFDRIRENQRLQTKNFSFTEVAELSINQVYTRSLNTSITTLTVLGCLFLFGGSTTTLFVGALFVGMLAGTYSSIFLASPLLVEIKRAGFLKKSVKAN
jgi:preprotein translocase subunit SecF